MSNNTLFSVSRCNGTGWFSILRSSEGSVIATSSMSLNAITTPAIAERTTLRDLYDMNTIGTVLLLASINRTIWPSWEDKSESFATDASEKPRTLHVARSNFGIRIEMSLLVVYIMALFNFQFPAGRSFANLCSITWGSCDASSKQSARV